MSGPPPPPPSGPPGPPRGGPPPPPPSDQAPPPPTPSKGGPPPPPIQSPNAGRPPGPPRPPGGAPPPPPSDPMSPTLPRPPGANIPLPPPPPNTPMSPADAPVPRGAPMPPSAPPNTPAVNDVGPPRGKAPPPPPGSDTPALPPPPANTPVPAPPKEPAPAAPKNATGVAVPMSPPPPEGSLSAPANVEVVSNIAAPLPPGLLPPPGLAPTPEGSKGGSIPGGPPPPPSVIPLPATPPDSTRKLAGDGKDSTKAPPTPPPSTPATPKARPSLPAAVVKQPSAAKLSEVATDTPEAAPSKDEKPPLTPTPGKVASSAGPRPAVPRPTAAADKPKDEQKKEEGKEAPKDTAKPAGGVAGPRPGVAPRPGSRIVATTPSDDAATQATAPAETPKPASGPRPINTGAAGPRPGAGTFPRPTAATGPRPSAVPRPGGAAAVAEANKAKAEEEAATAASSDDKGESKPAEGPKVGAPRPSAVGAPRPGFPRGPTSSSSPKLEEPAKPTPQPDPKAVERPTTPVSDAPKPSPATSKPISVMPKPSPTPEPAPTPSEGGNKPSVGTKEAEKPSDRRVSSPGLKPITSPTNEEKPAATTPTPDPAKEGPSTPIEPAVDGKKTPATAPITSTGARNSVASLRSSGSFGKQASDDKPTSDSPAKRGSVHPGVTSASNPRSSLVPGRLVPVKAEEPETKAPESNGKDAGKPAVKDNEPVSATSPPATEASTLTNKPAASPTPTPSPSTAIAPSKRASVQAALLKAAEVPGKPIVKAVDDSVSTTAPGPSKRPSVHPGVAAVQSNATVVNARGSVAKMEVPPLAEVAVKEGARPQSPPLVAPTQEAKPHEKRASMPASVTKSPVTPQSSVKKDMLSPKSSSRHLSRHEGVPEDTGLMATLEHVQTSSRLGRPIITSPQHSALMERIAKGELDAATIELLERIVADSQLQEKVRAVVAPPTPAVVTGDIKLTPPPVSETVTAPPPAQSTQRLGMGTMSLAGSGLPQAEPVVVAASAVGGSLASLPRPNFVSGSGRASEEPQEEDSKVSPRAKLADRLSTIQKLLNTGSGNVSERDLESLTMRDMMAYRQRLLDELRSNVTDVVATERAEWEKVRPAQNVDKQPMLALEYDDESVREAPVTRRRGRSPGKVPSHRHALEMEPAPYPYSARYPAQYSPEYVNPPYDEVRPSRRSRSRSKDKPRRHVRSQSRGRRTYNDDAKYPMTSPRDEFGDVRIVHRRATSKEGRSRNHEYPAPHPNRGQLLQLLEAGESTYGERPRSRRVPEGFIDDSPRSPRAAAALLASPVDVNYRSSRSRSRNPWR